MLTQTEKQKQFDFYWQTRDVVKADLRSQQRSGLAYSLLKNKGGKLLDVGCGRGWNALYFRDKGFEVEAIDVSPEAVELTRQKGIKATVVDLESRGINGLYDVILCLEILQFLNDPKRALWKLADALEPGGEIIVSVPNEFHFFRRIKILFGFPDLGGFDAPHLRFFYIGEMERLARACGLTVIDVLPISIIPPNLRYLQKAGELLAGVFPGLFSLSSMLKLAKY